MLAVRFARNFPDRASHLVLVNPLGLEDYRFRIPPSSRGLLFEREMNETNVEQIRAHFQRYVANWKPSVYQHFVEVRARVTLTGEYPGWAKAAALIDEMICQQPVRHEFFLIDPPTLLVIGQADRTAFGHGLASDAVLAALGNFPLLGRAAAKDIPRCKLVELPNVGHIPQLEAPQEFHKPLLDFLKPQ